jgi:uncharacterized protein (DUF4415 family)
MASSRIVRAVRIGGETLERRPDGTVIPLEDRSDYDRVDRTDDAEIERSTASRADEGPLTDDEWSRVEIVDPLKVPVTIRLDEDIVAWFKAGGARYQTRINAVLRQYVNARKKAG